VVEEVSKQVQPADEHVVCDVCGRTMLKGERPEPYLAPSRERKLVCQLCAARAQREGWIRESANADTPVQPPRPSERKGLFRRRRRRPATAETGLEQEKGVHAGLEQEASPAPSDDQSRPGQALPAPRMRDPRHVRAVPTNAQLKIERAIELFNESEHPRTVAGIARTLGSPQVSASTAGLSPAEVLLTIAWEISWYQFVVDLSDSNEPVRTHGQGQELEELPSEAQDWNARAEPDGRIAIGSPESLNGEEAEQGL
jgi:hypothetical protein